MACGVGFIGGGGSAPLPAGSSSQQASKQQRCGTVKCHAGRLKARGGFFESLPRALSQSLRPSKSKHKKKNTMQDEDKGRVAILKTVIEALQKGVRAC